MLENTRHLFLTCGSFGLNKVGIHETINKCTKNRTICRDLYKKYVTIQQQNCFSSSESIFKLETRLKVNELHLLHNNMTTMFVSLHCNYRSTCSLEQATAAALVSASLVFVPSPTTVKGSGYGT